MNRDCKTCKKGKDQVWNVCGYLPIEKRRKKLIDFPALKDASITIDACPVFFFNTYRYLYDWYNITLASGKDISLLNLGKRIVFREFGSYLNIRREYMLERERAKNGN